MPKQRPAKADRTPQGDETQEQADRRADDQDAALEAAFVAGTLPEEDRRASVPVEEGPPEGTPVEFGTADAGASLHQDNATTPHVKTGTDSPPNPSGAQLEELTGNG